MRVAPIALATCLALVGCSPIVGSECRAPLLACGHFCLDVRADDQNCGACGNFCPGGTSCISSVCVGVDAFRTPDGGSDAGRDAGLDVGIDVGTDVGIDVGLDAPDLGPSDAGPARCAVGQLLCGASCVPVNDPAHCGDCATACNSGEVCDDGSCVAACGGTSMDCSESCVDLARDHDHCGSCGMACADDEACSSTGCVAAGNGHVIVIGHDYVSSNASMNILLANAVLLPNGAPTRVLAYTGSTASLIVSSVNAALTGGAGTRTFSITTAMTRDEVPALLGAADTLLVHPQTAATSAEIDDLGQAWSVALGQFVHRGGVVVVLDTPPATNNGTNVVLAHAGLFVATSHSETLSPTLTVAAGLASDALLAGLTVPYVGQQHTVVFTTLDTNVVLSAATGPVVFHRSIAP